MIRPDSNLIDRVLSNTATPAEAGMVARWFATPEGQVELSQLISQEMSAMSEHESEQASVGHKIPSEKIFAQIEQLIRRHRRRRFMLSAAAILLPVLLILGIGIKLNSQVDLFRSETMQEIYVAKGERLQFLFQDGTRVYVNSDTRIEYPKRFGFFSRRIRIAGEAYFEVAKNPSRPFIVESQGCEVKVLGTEFNLDAYPTSKEIIVSLDNGHVVMKGKRNSYDLQPGEQLVYDKETGIGYIKRDLPTEENSQWKDNVIVFRDTPFELVIAELQRSYDIQIEVKDIRAYKYSFTISSDGHDLESVLHDLEMVAPVNFDRNGSHIEVTVNN